MPVWSCWAEGGFDAAVDLGLSELGCDADSVHDGALVGCAVADDTDSADTEQGRATVLGVIDALLEVLEGTAGEEGPDLGCDGGLEGLSQQDADQACGSLAGLDGDVANESIADDDVGVTVEEVAALDVADEVHLRACLEQGEGVVGEGVSLAVLLADGEEADAGMGDVQDVAGIHVAHDGELEEVVWVAIDVGANVEQDGGDSERCGQDGGEAWAMNSSEHSQNHFGCGHGCAGVPGGEETGGGAFADHAQPDAHGGVSFGADGLGGLVFHADPLGGVDDLDLRFLASVADRETAAQGAVEGRAKDLLRADEMDSDAKSARGEDGPANLRFGGFVGTHCINCYVDWHLGG